MEFTQQVKLTKEESKILNDFYNNKTGSFNCLGVKCSYCPLYIKDAMPSCLFNIIGNILRKYGYEEIDND